MKVGTDGVLLGAWVETTSVQRVLDVGTGTGLIALMLAQRIALAEITAVEIDIEAAGQARENAAASPWGDRIQILAQSVQEHTTSLATPTYDLIISNPPFFSGGVFSNQERRAEVRHTVKLPHSDLLRAAQKLLQPSGRLAVILPYLEGLRFQELASQYHLYPWRITEVHTRKEKPVERLLLEFGQEERPSANEKLVIHEAGENNWTEAYRNITRDFYLDF